MVDLFVKIKLLVFKVSVKKEQLGFLKKAIFVLMIFSFCFSFSFVSATWWDNNWEYRKSITITDTSGTELTDFQVPLDLTNVIYNNTDLVGSWHFSQGSGTQVSDSSGNGHNGSMIGGTTWAIDEGKAGNGLQFNGLDDYVTVPASSDWAFGTNNFTVEYWVKITGYNGPVGNKQIMGSYPGGTASWDLADWKFTVNPSTGILQFWVGDYYVGWQNFLSTSSVSENEWHHIAVVRTGTGTNETKMYIDGVLDAQGTISNNIANRYSLYFMRPIAYTGEESPTGTLDEVRIYNRALLETEIQDRFNSNKARLDLADFFLK